MTTLSACLLPILMGLHASPAPVAQGTSLAEAGQRLKALFGEAITISLTPEKARVEYCPDNTCEAFSGSGVFAADVQEFAMGYLLYASDYEALKPIRETAGAEAARQRILADADKAGCTGTPGTRAACWLRGHARRASLKTMFVRYDEGAKSEEPLDWSKQLDRLK